MADIIITSPEEQEFRKSLEGKQDPESLRIKRYLAMSDLSRTDESPIKALVDIVRSIPLFQGFDTLQFPEVVSTKYNFDLLNTPANHPSRQATDTYYLDASHILRTQTTAMWPYYLSRKETLEKLQGEGHVGLLGYGKVYRKDEIDRRHMNVFHQIDGLYICKTSEKKLGIPELQEVLRAIVKALYGENIEYRFLDDTFPFTNPSTQIEIERDGQWLEIVGSGVVHTQVLKNLGLDPNEYNGWAFGFGLERLAIASMELPDIRLLWSTDPRVTKQLKLGQKFVPVSKYPPITRDISFIVNKDFVPNNYFDLIRDIGGDLVEEVELLDKYENAEKFGADKLSYTYRVVYRSNDRTLTTEEIEPLQAKLYKETATQFSAEMR